MGERYTITWREKASRVVFDEFSHVREVLERDGVSSLCVADELPVHRLPADVWFYRVCVRASRKPFPD